MIRSILFNIFIIIAVAGIRAEEFTPRMMPNVNVGNRYEFVSDPGNLLSAEVKAEVNKRLWELRQNTTVEAVVAIPPSIGDTPIEDWSERLFTLWGIGKKDKDNGVLLVIVPEQRIARIQTGYGVEGALTDIASKNIIVRTIAPNMKNGNIDAAVLESTHLISQALSDPKVAEELRSEDPDNYSGGVDALSPDVIWNFVKIVAACCFFMSLAMFTHYLIAARRQKDYYHKAIKWRGTLVSFAVLSVFSLGTGIVFFLLALFLYRSYRTHRRKCSTCGARMKRLGEKEDNELLSDSQDFEEKLNTIDYDVWECPKCGTIERYAYKTDQQKYTECPKCHTVAMCLTGTRTLVPATVSHAGTGEKIYECKFCHHQKRIPYVIPKKESVAPLVAGAALGSMSRGGGGGFGGGFGGGSTGGGGASGGW